MNVGDALAKIAELAASLYPRRSSDIARAASRAFGALRRRNVDFNVLSVTVESDKLVRRRRFISVHVEVYNVEPDELIKLYGSVVKRIRMVLGPRDATRLMFTIRAVHL